MTENADELLLRITSEVFELEDQLPDLESVIHKLPNWDSLRHLKFIMSVESEFNMEMTPDEIESFKRVADVAEILRVHDS